MSPFIPIEDQFPEWPGALIAIEAAVLSKFEFGLKAMGELAFYTVRDVHECPQECCARLDTLFDKCSRALETALLTLNLGQFLNKNCTPALLCQINQLVADYDQRQIASRGPTLHALVLHELGIRQFYPG